MGEQLTVGQLSERIGKNTAQIRDWIIKHGLPIVSDNPRIVDFEVFQQWQIEYASKKGERRAERAEQAEARAATMGTSTGGQNKRGKKEEGGKGFKHIVQVLTEDEKRLMLWGRGAGRGWALARPSKLDQPWLDNFVSLVTHDGRESDSTINHLLQEAKAGTLYFLDPVAAVAFVAGQLEGYRQVHTGSSNGNAESVEALQTGLGHLQMALEALSEWRSLQTQNASTADVESRLRKAAYVKLEKEEIEDNE